MLFDASIITPATNIYRFATNHTTLYLRCKSVGTSHLIAGCGDKKMLIARPSVCANGIPATASQFEPLGADKLAVVQFDASIITPAANIYRFANNHTILYNIRSAHLLQ